MRRPTPTLPAALGLIAAGMLIVAFARPLPGPRTPAQLTAVLERGPHAGGCETCHTQHGNGPIVYPKALVGPNDNTLCDSCHETPWAGGSYAGTLAYAGSEHGSSAAAVWPGPDPPARTEAEAARKCLNCHDPHGREDGDGFVPRLALAREETLCLACHDGHPAATDVRSDLLKPFRHPATTVSGRHAGPRESSAEDFGISPVNRRHAECEDCHNPHLARRDPPLGLPAPEASKRLLGVSRVRVVNGAAGAAPVYTFTPASDTLTTPVAEYQLCFKCHSSWTVQPPGQTDLALVLNPANPSYHPVEAAGRNPGIRPGAFAPGWSAGSLTRCTDCHGSDVAARRGVHGSVHEHILRRPYSRASQPRSMSASELCFSCHAYDVYANDDAPEIVHADSRFNAPAADKGHAFHVGKKDVPCAACHTTHGSTTQRHLIVTGRNPGLVSYTWTPTGGTCATTCHGSESYTVNYAR